MMGGAAASVAYCYKQKNCSDLKQPRTMPFNAVTLLRPSMLAQAQASDDPYWRSRKNMPIREPAKDGTPSDFAILGGNSNPDLTNKVAKRLGSRLATGSVK